MTKRPAAQSMVICPPLVIEHSTTADMPDGQALPPFIDDGGVWHLVRRADGHTLWRRISITSAPASALPGTP
jgi:hypothetical protein